MFHRVQGLFHRRRRDQLRRPLVVWSAKLALEIVKERLELVAPQLDELKFDLIGCNSLYWNPDFKYNEPSEVRVLGVAGRAKTKAVADPGNEWRPLYTNGSRRRCGAVKRTGIVSVAPSWWTATTCRKWKSLQSDKRKKAMKLWDIAHSRTGDKGNISNVSLIAYASQGF